MIPQYAVAQNRPDIVVFDGDTFCAADASIAYRIPRVARVGTGLRDAYTNPVYTPQYGSALSVHMDWRARLANAALLVLSRQVIGPMVLPGLYAKHRQHWLRVAAHLTREAETAGTDSRRASRAGDDVQHEVRHSALSSHNGIVVDEAEFNVELTWDGWPTLFNTHWGLEHARPLAPFEHAIGHCTDFEAAASRPLPAHVAAWLDASDVPVVYVALGTLGVVSADHGRGMLSVLAAAARSSRHFRFLWSVPAAQRSNLPNELVARSAAAEEYFAAHNKDSESTDDSPPNSSAGAQFASPGSVLLVSWVPQVAALVHDRTAVFLTHGGMNSIGDGTYAQTPMLCMPLFSDQPDNCQHAADHGYALVLRRSEVLGAHNDSDAARIVEDRLLRLHVDASFRDAIRVAWARDVAAGGVPTAIRVIEATAAEPYEGRLHLLPRIYTQPWYQRRGLDIAAAVIMVALLAGLPCCVCCRVAVSCLRYCRSCKTGAVQ